jgi:hypothetical protein
MGTITLANLRTRARDRANMENSTFVSDSIFNSYINYAISDLRDIITSKVGEDYFATSSSTTLTSGQETLSLPADFYKLLWVEVLVDGTTYHRLNRFEISELPSAPFSLANPWVSLKYRLRADNLWFSPSSATGGRTIRTWYVPLPTALSADADTLNGYNGWDEYVVLLAARKALVKEEQDVNDIDREILAINQRIEAMAPNRDQGQPMRIYDNEQNFYPHWSEL